MTMELVAGAAVTLAVLLFVLEPLVRPRPEPDETDEPDLAPLEESASPRVQALLALKEIEFDRATGKLDEADYAALRRCYEAAAVSALADEADPTRPRMVRCATCGPRPEAGAVFCSQCGRPLAA